MIEMVFPDIYKIDIPLPHNPLRSTNSYFVRGTTRNLLVDTGFNCPESRQAMTEALQSLNADMETTDLFITHLHSDHAGLLTYLATPATVVWMSAADAAVVGASKNSSHWKMFSEFLPMSGLVASGVENNYENHPGYKFAPDLFSKFTLVNEGFEIKVGSYTFKCLETSGHTAGHICLYDPYKRLLLSGDHILGKITPNITLWQLGTDVLGNYLNSLDKIYNLEVDLVLPGHRYLIADCRGRINELRAHHQRRLEDVTRILGSGRMNAVEVASQMNWDLSYSSWDDFPWGQKLFATGEAMSHLYHLAMQGKVSLTSDNGIIYFEKL